MRHRLANPSNAFVRGITLRTPGVAIRDVRIGAARVVDPLAWETPPCRLRIDGDSAEITFHRPDNWARFGFDIDHKLSADTLLNFSVHAAGIGPSSDVSAALSIRRAF